MNICVVHKIARWILKVILKTLSEGKLILPFLFKYKILSLVLFIKFKDYNIADTRSGNRNRSSGVNSLDWSDSSVFQPMGQDKNAVTLPARLQTRTTQGNFLIVKSNYTLLFFLINDMLFLFINMCKNNNKTEIELALVIQLTKVY